MIGAAESSHLDWQFPSKRSCLRVLVSAGSWLIPRPPIAYGCTVRCVLKKKQLPRYERPGFPGWWFQPTPLQNMEVSWDDEIPNIWEMHVPNHQPEMVSGQKKRHF